MTDITYHVGNHVVKSELRHFEANESHGEFCCFRIDFETAEGEKVSELRFIVNGNEAHAKDILSAIKAAL